MTWTLFTIQCIIFTTTVGSRLAPPRNFPSYYSMLSIKFNVYILLMATETPPLGMESGAGSPSTNSMMKISALISAPMEDVTSKPKKRASVSVATETIPPQATTSTTSTTSQMPAAPALPVGPSEDIFDPNSAVVDLTIPISTHYDIHTEFNYPWLMEEKYGVGPASLVSKWAADDTAGVAVDEDGDGEADADEEDEEDEEEAQANTSVGALAPSAPSAADDHAIVKFLGVQFNSQMTDAEKEALVLSAINKREAKNNQRLGKYDVYDPFIDDEELEVEEQGSHVQGWFVWTGELADSAGTDIAKIVEKELHRHEVVQLEDTEERTEGRKRRSEGPSPNDALEPVRRKRVKAAVASVPETQSEETPKAVTKNAAKTSKKEETTSKPVMNAKTPTATTTPTPAPAPGLIIGNFNFNT